MPPQRGVVTQVTYAPSRDAVALRVQPEDRGADVLVTFQGKKPLAGLVAEGNSVELHGKRRLVDLTTGAILEHHTASSWWPVLVVLLLVGGLIASQVQWKTVLPPVIREGTVPPPPSSALGWRHPPMQGEEVRAMQHRLRALGYLNDRAVDGVFGATTATAVRRFQQRHGLVPDGQMGQRTWAVLFSAEARARASAAPGAQR